MINKLTALGWAEGGKKQTLNLYYFMLISPILKAVKITKKIILS